MTYWDLETSEYSGQPIELYTFTRQGNVWRYTSADEDKTANAFLYLAYPISRSRLEQTQQMSKSPIQLKMSKDVPVLAQYRSTPPSSITTLTIQRYHEGLASYVTSWMGRITNVKFAEREATVQCESLYTPIRRPILRRRYQTSCPLVLYENGCNVNRASYAVPATLSANNGGTILSGAFAAHPNGYFTGGYVLWQTNTDVQIRFITGHVADTLTLDLPFGAMPSNADVTAYPGCDHLLQTCHDKYNNEDNYGGQPFYPGKNPFNGTSIF